MDVGISSINNVGYQQHDIWPSFQNGLLALKIVWFSMKKYSYFQNPLGPTPSSSKENDVRKNYQQRFQVDQCAQQGQQKNLGPSKVR